MTIPMPHSEVPMEWQCPVCKAWNWQRKHPRQGESVTCRKCRLNLTFEEDAQTGFSPEKPAGN